MLVLLISIQHLSITKNSIKLQCIKDNLIPKVTNAALEDISSTVIPNGKAYSMKVNTSRIKATVLGAEFGLMASTI